MNHAHHNHNAAQTLVAVRTAMRVSSPPLDALLVPNADEHQSEYTPDCAQRRAFITGFTGSAGDALVTADHAYLWTDGRYWTQALQQLDANHITLQRSGAPGVPSLQTFLSGLHEGAVVGVDARTISWRAFADLHQALAPRNIALVDTGANLIDAVWSGRLPLPRAPVRLHPPHLAGESTADKLARLRDALAERSAQAHAISSLDAIAWLFNLRGADIPFNPLFLAHAIITDTRAILFTDASRLTDEARASLQGVADVLPYERFEPSLLETHATRWWIDEQHSSARTAAILESYSRRIVERSRSPVFAAKAAKNPAELAASRLAHTLDAVALINTLRWFEREAPASKLTELDVADRVDADRRAHPDYLAHSFFPIAAAGPNAAVIHYRPARETNRAVRADELFLLDCGAHYLQAATDVTRTLHPATPSPAQRRNYTTVLKAHIALASLRFPPHANGVQLDAVARLPLWRENLDYNHGTGHGVGISVHESPPSVSPRAGSLAPLAAGMILSIEPGIYVPDHFGIRLENLYEVVADGDALRFEALTLLPFQRTLIDSSLLTPEERDWLNAYHARVVRELTLRLDAEAPAGLPSPPRRSPDSRPRRPQRALHRSKRRRAAMVFDSLRVRLRLRLRHPDAPQKRHHDLVPTPRPCRHRPPFLRQHDRLSAVSLHQPRLPQSPQHPRHRHVRHAQRLGHVPHARLAALLLQLRDQLGVILRNLRRVVRTRPAKPIGALRPAHASPQA